MKPVNNTYHQSAKSTHRALVFLYLAFFTYLWFISGLDDEDEDEEEEDDELGTRLGGAIENDWSDWRGDLSGAVCLFCPGEHKSNFKDGVEVYTHYGI